MKFGISLHRRYFNIIHPTLFVALPCFRHYSKRGESGTLFPSAAFGTDFTHLTEGRNLRGLLFFGTAPCVFIWVGISMSVLPPPMYSIGQSESLFFATYEHRAGATGNARFYGRFHPLLVICLSLFHVFGLFFSKCEAALLDVFWLSLWLSFYI